MEDNRNITVKLTPQNAYVIECIAKLAQDGVNVQAEIVAHLMGKLTVEGLALQAHLKAKFDLTAKQAIELLGDTLNEVGFIEQMQATLHHSEHARIASRILDLLSGRPVGPKEGLIAPTPPGFTLNTPDPSFFPAK